MSETLAPPLEKAPDHVPPELAFPFRVGSAPGIEKRAFQAVIGAFRERPDIFFAVGGARTGPGTWIVTREKSSEAARTFRKGKCTARAVAPP